MTLTVEVTQEDIDQGVKGSCRLCPVAMAMSRALRVPITCVPTAYLIEDCEWHRLPRVAIDFIGRFDSGAPVKPFSFQINVPAKAPT